MIKIALVEACFNCSQPTRGFMKLLIASIPASGHLNPLLSIASLLVESGHEVAMQVNEDLRSDPEAELLSLIEECVPETVRG